MHTFACIYIYRHSTDFPTKKSFNFCAQKKKKKDLRSCNFLYSYFCIYQPIGAFAFVFKFPDSLLITIFHLP